MRIRFIALLAAVAVLAAPMAAFAQSGTAPARDQVRAEAQQRLNIQVNEPSQDRVRDRIRSVDETDRPPVERIEHFIRTHPWLARWIATLPCETDDCIPPRLQHWFRTHPTAAHWIFWYVRTHVI
jgi:ElaB/YqjD/DUF883 family membrane-anchored ribosome-binding protein